MSYVKRIVCLASSWKHAGRCIVGKRVLPTGYGEWTRPVSARAGAEISDEERRCTDGSMAEPLHVLDIPLERPVPQLHQTENHLIDPGARWVKVDKLPAAELESLVDHPPQLWPNGVCTVHGLNDRVSAGATVGLDWSLALIEPEEPCVLVQDEGGKSKLKVRADFVYRGVPYNLSITDPAVMRAFRKKPPGRYPLAACWLSVSLSERYTDGYCYKLAAAVIAKPIQAEFSWTTWSTL
jgi:hypothetical protein